MKMKNKLIDLMNVKSIVTIIMTITFSALTANGKVSGEQFLIVFTTVIAFYFGTHRERKDE